jgi:uncharacterized protein (UPF0297 family)
MRARARVRALERRRVVEEFIRNRWADSLGRISWME